MKPSLKGEIIDKIAVPGVLTAFLYKFMVVEIVWDKKTEVITKKELTHVQNSVKKLGKGKKMPLYFTAHEFLLVNPEGEKYATSKEGTKYSLAIAVLLDNLAIKIDYNSFVKRNKPVVPTKGFINQEEAVKWLVEHYNS